MLLLLLFPHLSTQRFGVVNNVANCACIYLFFYYRGNGACPDMVDHGRVLVGSFCRLLNHEISNDSEH